MCQIANLYTAMQLPLWAISDKAFWGKVGLSGCIASPEDALFYA